jgi:hypothetical protein
LRTRPGTHSHKEWFEIFRSMCASLACIMEVLQRRNVIYGDLSTNNLLVLRQTGELKIIDFEGAYEVGVDRPATLYTPGFVSDDRLSGAAPRFSDDHYSMGAVLLAYLFPLNGLFHLNPGAKHEVMKSIQRDARLPHGMASMVLDLMDPNSSCRPTPAKVLEIARSATGPEEERNDTEEREPGYESLLQGIVAHLNEVATYDRRDRLFPSDPKLFTTNPLSLAYGASGVAYALHRVGGQVPQAALDWLLSHRITREAYPPGFYIGLAGIAVVLLELGARKEAEKVLQMSFGHRLLYTGADVFYGIAGWGLANLRFFLDSRDELYLDKAEQAGNHLIRTSQFATSGRYWKTLNEVRIGFAHGASGIGLFLLYLYLATNDDRFLQAGQEGLDFDLAHGRETKDGGLSWPHMAGVESPLYPYWRSGSAGIGGVVLRFYRLLGEQRYHSILEKVFIDVDRRYTVSPGRFMGLAGLGDSVLDMYEFSGESRYLHSAWEIAKSVIRFRVDRIGVAFPGDFLSRLCCDFGTGSAGVALFLNRLLGRQNGDFTLDALFGLHARRAPVLTVACSA